MSVFNEFHYPTPPAVADKALAPLVKDLKWATDYYGRKMKCLPYKSILDPSGGSGAYVDRLVEEYGIEKNDISCIEIDPELQATLTGKGYKVIDSDFLAFSDPIYFDLIVMNPPWRNGVDHALKAWDVVADGGAVTCILNAETVRNQNSEKRKLLGRLIEQYGSCDFIGSVFYGPDVERTTSKEAVIIWLHKPQRDKTVEFGSDYDKDAFVAEVEYNANPLASSNILESLVAQYEGAKAALIEQEAAEAKYLFYVSAVRNRGVGDDCVVGTVSKRSLNEKITSLKKDFWRYVFDKTSVGKRTTSQVQKEFEKFQTETSNLSFNMPNIKRLLETLMASSNQIIEKCLLDTFDKATSLHEKNTVHTEGWKTNKSYRLNKKIIVPWGIDTNYSSWHMNYHKSDFYHDLDKVMCFLSKKKIEDVKGVYAAISERMTYLNRNSSRYDEMIESEFFYIRFFKKGTVHLVFKDQDLLDRFNIAAAQGKNWIGGGY